MADLVDVPGCCTTKIIVGLGPGGPIDATARRAAEGVNPDVAAIEADIEQLEYRARREGNAFVLASTNDEQQAGVQALLNRGFAHSRGGTKERHPETRVRLWYKRLNR